MTDQHGDDGQEYVTLSTGYVDPRPVWHPPENEPVPTREIEEQCRADAEREFVDACREEGIEPTDELRKAMLGKGRTRWDRLRSTFTFVAADPDGDHYLSTSSESGRVWGTPREVLRYRWKRNEAAAGRLIVAPPPAAPPKPGEPYRANAPTDAFGRPLQGRDLLMHARDQQQNTPRDPGVQTPGGFTRTPDGRFVTGRGHELRGVELLAEARNQQRGKS